MCGRALVAVAQPVALTHVYLHVTSHKLPILAYEKGVSEVRPHAGGWTSWVEDV